VDFHLHVVAGAMHVLQPLSSAPVTVYLTDKVLNHNHFGFMEWLGSAEGFEYKDCSHINDKTAYDLVWLISPEWDVTWTEKVLQTMQYKVALLYVHNGHMPDDEFSRIRRFSPQFPLLTMSPHVADYVSDRLQQTSSGSSSDKDNVGAATADWVLPIWPYQPSEPITKGSLQASVVQGDCPLLETLYVKRGHLLIPALKSLLTTCNDCLLLHDHSVSNQSAFSHSADNPSSQRTVTELLRRSLTVIAEASSGTVHVSASSTGRNPQAFHHDCMSIAYK
jgi:hypothetical protein